MTIQIMLYKEIKLANFDDDFKFKNAILEVGELYELVLSRLLDIKGLEFGTAQKQLNAAVYLCSLEHHCNRLWLDDARTVLECGRYVIESRISNKKDCINVTMYDETYTKSIDGKHRYISDCDILLNFDVTNDEFEALGFITFED